MRRVIFLLTFMMLVGCDSKPMPDISATLAALPLNPSIQSSHIVLQAFFDAYNDQDLVGVLSTLADTFAYGDCDFAEKQMFIFETIPDLTTWLQRKFGDEDQFQIIEMIIAPPEGSPAMIPAQLLCKF